SYIILRKASIAYETPYYFRFMMYNKVVEFANMRYGIYNEGDHSVAYIQAIQSSQQITENEEYYEISNTIKRDLPKSRYFREFNPMHMASLVLFLGLINGLGIQEVHGSDYFSLRYQRLAIEKNKSEEEMNIYQHRLTNKFINTFMRLIEYTDDINIIKYPEDGDGFILKLNNDIHFSSPILQELYDMAYNSTKKQSINVEKELKLK
ncbi:MAG: hypothetical protein K2I70_04140, partial [Bacilli bacterium]|nr:hypothetical protein [Bacilli bacterium]